MNYIRNPIIGQKFFTAKNLKYHSYSLDNKKKANKKSSNKTNKDCKTLFKSFYKSKNKQRENNSLRNSFNDINNYYLKCQNTVQEFFLNNNNQFGLKTEGNKALENYSLDEISIFLNKTCSYRESILKNKLLNYYYPKDNKNKLMGKEMTLTPIPYKKNVFIKDKIEKENYLKAKRSAVFMRKVEYTHGLKNYKNKEIIQDKNDYILIIKGAIKIIEDWWKSILIKKRKMKKEIFETLSSEEKESMNSIEKNIIKNLKRKDSDIINSDKNGLIDKWIITQINNLIGNEMKMPKEHIHKNNLLLLIKSKNFKNIQIEDNNKDKTNNITVFKSNKTKNNINNNNKRYNYFELNSRNSHKQETIQSVQNPVKLVPKNTFSCELSSKEDTNVSPSENLQKYFKQDFSTKYQNTDKTSSKQTLQTLELIPKKYTKNNSNIETEGFYSINTLENLLTQENKNINSIESSREKSINSKTKRNNDRYNNIKIIENKKKENKNNNINFSNNSKNITSDIEPIKQDEMINIEINNNLADLDKNKKKKKNYKINYNITKSKSSNKNLGSDKSSMDGSVDEIIIKKLKDFYVKDNKYSQRINKAFNQVLASKKLGKCEENNFN